MSKSRSFQSLHKIYLLGTEHKSTVGKIIWFFIISKFYCFDYNTIIIKHYIGSISKYYVFTFIPKLVTCRTIKSINTPTHTHTYTHSHTHTHTVSFSNERYTAVASPRPIRHTLLTVVVILYVTAAECRRLSSFI